jgi:hypothetical protein
MAALKPWSVFVWIAGDNDLDEFGLTDIKEMKEVGSTAEVDVVVQFDRMGDTGTNRYHLQKGTSLEEDLVEEIGETNTGDPAVAIDFFAWGLKNYPSERVLAVLWNHGSGIDESEIYARAKEKGVLNGGQSDDRIRAVFGSKLRRALFCTTVEAALDSKAIALDDTSRDFLDNIELKRVLEEVVAARGKPIDVLGFDACLMNLIEIGYQLKEYASYLVGSEEVEPGQGWPYTDVIQFLTSSPDASPAELARAIVRAYLASYDGESITLSALDLSRIGAAADAADRLAETCIAALETSDDYYAFDKALKGTQRFYLRDFCDLGDFCRQLDARWQRSEVAEVTSAMLDVLSGDNPLVIESGSEGDRLTGASGAAIYFPLLGDVTVVYDQLDFAQATRWNGLIAKYREA